MSEALEIPRSLEGERVDRVLSLLSGRSRASAIGLIKKGAVSLSGKTVDAGRQRVVAGDLLVIDVADHEHHELLKTPPAIEIDFEVVHADDAIIVVNKPAGLVVHPGAGHENDTLVSGLLARYVDLQEWSATADDPKRPGIVHRLDKDTSGLLVVARTKDAYENLTGQLRRREMGRNYISLVIGHLSAASGTIEAPIGRSNRNRTSMAVHASGKPATTHYRVLRRFDAPTALSLVDVALETGRTHQIRVHFAAIDHPVVGDPRYGVRTKLALNRPFLHAGTLTLTHPGTGEVMSFTSPLPQDLESVLETCA